MPNDPDCVFCKIVAGVIPCAKLLDEEHALAFLDIGPVAPGHALLIPRDHYETMDTMPPDAAAAMFRRLPALVKAVRAVTGCEGVNVLQNNGAIAGQVVPHVHVHVIPREPAGRFSFNWPAGQYEKGQIDSLARAIRERLSQGEMQ
ncbi:MAG: HIT domain-containing protein [Phycisphaerae bacterium]|nr:HIT domain-containing protein [Phycisphaerae bacterium]